MGEHAGHRKRMITRLAEGTLCDHEYLEMLLFYAIPRRNTNDIAHRLLARFGDLNGVLNAPMKALQEIDGVGRTWRRCLRFWVRFARNTARIALQTACGHSYIIEKISWRSSKVGIRSLIYRMNA